MEFKGLTAEEVLASRKANGSNVLTEIPPDPLWKKVLEGFKDPMIMILCVALVIQVVLYYIGQAEWYEPFGIFVAICIANGVASWSESKQEGKASALKAEELAKEKAKVIRDGKLHEISVTEVVVGDIVYVQAGDKLPADGEVKGGRIKVDQASLNGETEEAVKEVNKDNTSYDVKDLVNRFYAYRGTVVCDGEGYIEVKTVGDKTLFGQLALEVQEETRETPLQVKLGKLADQISKFGYCGAIAIVLGILAKAFIGGSLPTDMFGWMRFLVDAITVAVTIVVCAVPEGLPMLTSILLSFQSFKMAKDNVLVRKIRGLETAGSLNILFSDKTGTITKGKLSVVELTLGSMEVIRSKKDYSEKFGAYLKSAIGTNNGSSYADNKVIGGNSTDRALMEYLVKEYGSYTKETIKSSEPFDSAKKYSSVTLVEDGNDVVYLKGAPEKIIPQCNCCFDKNGVAYVFNDPAKELLAKYLDGQASRAMRLLAVAKKTDFGVVLLCIVSIRDDVRQEAAEAIVEMQKAGIHVVMVTGDRKETAQAIAKEAGLLTEVYNEVLTSAEMQNMSDDELKHILPRLAVVSRALPTDKSRLVRIAQEQNLVVGMTGDGVNDSPALKKADVGFAMGSGTDVAKEAGDITILDDNLASIEKAVLYGRTMFKSIRKFLIFQLTVNIAAVATCFLAPLFGENVVLTVVQLLLINLAMDTLAAIAFGSEPALKEYMQEMPVPRDASIISKDMAVEILLAGVYITIACLSVLFVPCVRSMFDGAADIVYMKSVLFAVFMMAITFNGFNARTAHYNVFENLGRNTNFILVIAGIFIMQYVFVTFGGDVLSVRPLSVCAWLTAAVISALVIPIDVVRKLICDKK